MSSIKKTNSPLILSGEFIKIPNKSYPGRIYGEYKFNWDKDKWEIDKEFCKKYNIKF